MDQPEEPDSPGPGTGVGGDAQERRIAHFIELLSDDEAMNRIRAAETLGRIGSVDAVEPLVDSLWDDDARVRLKAAWALGRIGHPDAVAPLRRLYRMENEDAREIIRDALEAISRSGPGPE